MIERFGKVVEVSKDQGPFMLLRVQCEMRTFTAQVSSPYGLDASPEVGSLVIVHPNPDGGMEKVTPYNLSANRPDQLKEGEAQFGNTKTGSNIKCDKDGDMKMTSKQDTIIGSGGIVHINPE